MDTQQPTTLLAGLSPQAFMRRHWHKKPLLVRGAFPGIVPPLDRAALFALAGQEGVESRLVQRQSRGWTLRHGPFTRRQLPPLTRREWTLLVQGVDLHSDAAHALISQFRFVPDARLDDLMISYASDGGGVGPHFDSYDVFLLQVQGRRRWRIGRNVDPRLEPGVPLKILSNFVVEEEWLLEPGDMLYLPPQWAHDGVAEGECITCSIGFRSASRDETAREVLQLALDAAVDDAEDDNAAPAASPRYRDPAQLATDTPARVPDALKDFARDAVQRLVGRPGALDAALGEWLSTPKPQVWFDAADDASLDATFGVRLDRRTRMLYDEGHVFINGESFRAGGRDATLMRALADRRRLGARELSRVSEEARELVEDWLRAGWLHLSKENVE